MEALGIDIKLLFAQALNFILFAYIFQKFLNKPFQAYIKKQKGEEEEKDKLLKDLQEKEESLSETEREVIAMAREKSLKILKDAEDMAQKKKKEIIEKAHTEVEAMKLKAQQDILEEKKKLYDEIKDHIVQTSETLAEAVLIDFIDVKKQQDILKNIFKKLDKSSTYEN